MFPTLRFTLLRREQLASYQQPSGSDRNLSIAAGLRRNTAKTLRSRNGEFRDSAIRIFGADLQSGIFGEPYITVRPNCDDDGKRCTTGGTT